MELCKEDQVRACSACFGRKLIAGTSTITEWNGYLCPSVSYQFRSHRELIPAWDEVAAKKDEEKKLRDNEFRANHPHLAEWKEVSRMKDHHYLANAQRGRQLYHPYHFPPSEHPRASEPVPEGTCRVQVLRSAADWSHGILLEDSIQRERQVREGELTAEAYIGLIREANHCIYIENQFCERLLAI